MNKKSLVFLVISGLILCSGCIGTEKYKKVVYQYSTINAFMSGFYEGDLKAAELKRRGDFGIGTFNGINGELILLGSRCYRAKADGTIALVKGRELIPFAVVKCFKPSELGTFQKPLNYKELLEYLDALIPAGNYFVAIKVEGNFSYVKTRSIEKQNRPYKPFSEVAKNQWISEFRNLKGTLVGFRFPGYMKELNVPGYHFHFISRDKKFGGHLLECNLTDGVIVFDEASSFFMQLPADNDFKVLDLAKDRQKELLKAEK